MKKRLLFLYVVASFISTNAQSQTILDDAKGGNLIVGFLPGIFKANIADASLSFGYSVNFDKNALDFNLKGKASNGISSILSIGKLTPEALIELGYSYHISDLSNTSIIDSISDAFDSLSREIHRKEKHELKEAKTAKDSIAIEKKYEKEITRYELQKHHAVNRASGFIDDKAGVLLGYQNSKYTFFNSSVAFKDQITKQQFEAGSIKLYNTAFFRGLDMLSTLMVTFKRKNNIDDLTQKTVTVTSITKDSSGNTTHTTKQDIPVWSGNYETFPSFDVTLGSIIKPWDEIQVGLSGFVRYNSWSDSKSQKFVEAGIGIHLLDDSKIFSPRVGLMVQYSSKELEDNSDDSFKNQVSVNLNAALPFSF